jgi:peptidoglycan hydrolase-like protein with peptidoglycan-binding domain
MTKQGCQWFRVLAAAWAVGVAAGCAAPAENPKAAEPPPAPAPSAPPPPAAAAAPAAPGVEAAKAAPEPAAPPAAAAMGGKELQELLAARGYKPGPIDGKPGPKTREALKAFQKDAGLPATGVLDAETSQRLRAAPSKR